MKKKKVGYIRSALVPVVHGCDGQSALNAALRLAADVILIGVVYVPQHESLSTGAYQARQVRRLLRELSAGPQVRYKAEVQVSHTPWTDLVKVIAEDEPDLLLLEWKCPARCAACDRRRSVDASAL